MRAVFFLSGVWYGWRMKTCEMDVAKVDVEDSRIIVHEGTYLKHKRGRCLHTIAEDLQPTVQFAILKVRAGDETVACLTRSLRELLKGTHLGP